MAEDSGVGFVLARVAHPAAGGWIGGLLHALHDRVLAQGGEGLGAMWGEEKTREYLTRAGFRSITTHRLAHDIQNNWYGVTQ